jgi:hypothetical protein
MESFRSVSSPRRVAGLVGGQSLEIVHPGGPGDVIAAAAGQGIGDRRRIADRPGVDQAIQTGVDPRPGLKQSQGIVAGDAQPSRVNQSPAIGGGPDHDPGRRLSTEIRDNGICRSEVPAKPRAWPVDVVKRDLDFRRLSGKYRPGCRRRQAQAV